MLKGFTGSQGYLHSNPAPQSFDEASLLDLKQIKSRSEAVGPEKIREIRQVTHLVPSDRLNILYFFV